MSTATHTPVAGDFGDWDDFLKFAVVTDGLRFDPEPDDDLAPCPHHRRPRGADRRAAIDESLRGL